MKFVKIALFAIAGLLVLLVVAVVVLSLPAVQRAVVTRLIPTEPGESLEIDYFRAGLNRTEARGFHFIQPDAAYRVAEFTADVSLFDLLFRRELRIGELIVTGLVIDLSELEPDPDGEREPFDGILGQMELPMPLYLDRLRVDGQVLLPGLADQPMLGEFVLAGGGFAPDQEGSLNLSGDLQSSGQTELPGRLGVEGTVTLFQADRGRIERARLLAFLSAPEIGAGPGETLSADVLLLATEDGEAYQARVGRILTNQTDERDISTLILLDASYRHEEGLLEGRWEIDVDHEQLAAFVAEMELPVFAASGNGGFSYGMTDELFDVTGQLEINVEDLSVIAEELGELGGFNLVSRFNVTMDEEILHLEGLVVELRDEQNGNLVEVRNFQPIRYNRQTERLEDVKERFDLAEFTIHALPVEWANLLIPAGEGEPEWLVRGGDLTGQLIVSAEEEGLFFRMVEPLQASGISIFSEGEPLLADISFEAQGSGSFQNGRMEGTLELLQLFHQGQSFLTVSGSYDSAAEQVEARVEVDLPVFLEQPALADFGNLASGSLDLRMSVTLGELQLIEINGSARDLVNRDEQEEPGDFVFQATLRERAEDVWEVEVPIRLEAAVPSDLRLAGEIVMGEVLNRFDLNLTGGHLGLEDMMALAAAFSAPEATPVETAPVNERDEEPVWAGFEGVVTVNIDRIQVHEEYALDDLEGDLTVDSDSIVNSIRGRFLDSPVDLEARLVFFAEEARPYVLDGSLDAPALAVGEIFRQLQPDRPPTVEGLFVVSLDFESTGRNMPDLVNRVRGQARLRSGGGTVRLLHTDNPMAGLGIAAGTILGTVRDEVRAISQIAARLSNMPYNEMNILAERDEEMNFILRDFLVLSPEMHLQGVGEIRHREGVEILQQPMSINLQLGALGPLEELLGTVRVLGDHRDELGYRQLRRDFTISGTPANPDAAAFYRMLVDTVLRFVLPGDRGREEERPRIPQIPDVFDFLRGNQKK